MRERRGGGRPPSGRVSGGAALSLTNWGRPSSTPALHTLAATHFSDDGSGRYYEDSSCALKTQPPIPAGGQPSVYAAGKLVMWSTGYLPA